MDLVVKTVVVRRDVLVVDEFVIQLLAIPICSRGLVQSPAALLSAIVIVV
jgi:hypothetical protein